MRHFTNYMIIWAPIHFATKFLDYQNVITRGILSLVFMFSILSYSDVTYAAQSQITSIRHWVGPHRTRLVLESNDPLAYKVFDLKQPHRIVIDLKQAKLAKTFPRLNLSKSLITSIRTAKRFEQDLRVVLDVKYAAAAKALTLEPTKNYRHRLVLDISPASSTQNAKKTSKRNKNHAINKRKYISKRPDLRRPVIIAIDAGHGGEDPGAIGKLGSEEKDIVLSISDYLYALIKKEPGMTPVQIRTGDYFISLRGRIRAARKAKADLFISIHADAAKNSLAKGSSVYILSQRSASSEAARWLADTQNNSDLIGGVILDDKDDLLAKVLLNLTQNATLVASNQLANTLISEMQQIGPVHNNDVEKAGFVVLKSPDIPSVLVETGFISNRSQEKQLRSPVQQKKIAKAILKGVRQYFKNNSMPGTLFARAGRVHRIKSGETLGLLARRYKVSIMRLRSINQLASDVIRVGQILKIPRITGG